MSFELAAVLGLLIAAIVMFTIDRPRMDAVALIVIVLLPLTGVVTIREVLGGFADSNVLLIAAMFVLGECLARTGVARMLGDQLARRAGKSRSRLITLLMTTVGIMGSTMSSTAITAIFIPVVMRIARITGNPPGKLMMPLSVAALVSGMTTLVATAPNLVVNAELVRRDLPGFGFFAFTPIGIPVLLCAVVYMILASRWLPDGAQTPSERRRKPTLSEWSERYRLTEREHRLRVTPGSPFAGQTLEEPVGGLHVDELDALVSLERLDDLLALVLAHEAGVDEHARELVADGLVHERRGDRRVDAAGQAADGAAVADLGPDLLDGLLDEVLHGPRGVDPGQAVRAGDRIEIYRPLSADPKAVRRARAATKRRSKPR